MEVNIAYSSSDAYAKCTGISILSLFHNNQDIKKLTVYLFSTDISNQNKQIIYSIAKEYGREVKLIDVNKRLERIAEQFQLTALRGGYNTYVRLFASAWLEDIDRVLFIDSDTLVVGSVYELFSTNMNGKLIAAVPEIGMYGRYNCGDDIDIVDKCEKYINAGIMLINLQLWREDKISEYIARRITEYQKEWHCSEQSIFNYTINNRCKYVHLKNNYYSVFHYDDYKTIDTNYDISRVFTREECEDAAKAPIILHFIGLPYSRPWYESNISPFKELYEEYYKKSPWNGIALDSIPKNPQIGYRIYDYIMYFTRKHKMYRINDFLITIFQGKLKKYLRGFVEKRK